MPLQVSLTVITKWFIAGCLMISLTILIFTLTLFFLNTILPRYPLHDTPALYGMPFEDVAFQATDGIHLTGWLIMRDTTKPTIIICHGLGANKSDLLSIARCVFDAGFNVFVFDFRGHGDSGGLSTSFGYLEQRDLLSAVDYLRRRKDPVTKRYGVYGVSMGAAVALMTAGKTTLVKTVIADSSYATLEGVMYDFLGRLMRLPRWPFWPVVRLLYNIRYSVDIQYVSPMAAIRALSPRAVLLIAGERDDRMLPTYAQELYQTAREPKGLWIIPGAGHLEGYGMMPEQYEEKVTGFFQRHLL